MYKAVLFDLDGVLTVDATGTTSIINYFTDVVKINKEQFTKAYRKYNHDFLYGNTKHTDVWDSICKELAQKIDIQVLYDAFAKTPLDFDMYDLAKSIKKEGYTVGIITDNKSDRVKIISDIHHFEEVFDVIVVSDQVGSGKKEKPIFDITLKKLGYDYEDCVFIDNNENNLTVPAANGMATLFYDHNKRDLNVLKDNLNAVLKSDSISS